MPYYDYACEACGPFTEKRMMAEAAVPQPCPMCGVAAPRAILSAPRIAGMDPARRTAMATNERSAHAPRLSSAGHGSGCSCCRGPKITGKTAATTLPAAAKSFPSARPWMISH